MLWSKKIIRVALISSGKTFISVEFWSGKNFIKFEFWFAKNLISVKFSSAKNVNRVGLDPQKFSLESSFGPGEFD